MNSEQQQQALERLAAMQNLQEEAETEASEEDLETLYQEALGLIREIGPSQDNESLEHLEEFWGQALAGFGPDWEDILDDVLDEAEAAQSEEVPYHHNGYMYWYVLERCYELLKEEEVALHRHLFRECLSCLRATRTLQESVAREAAEETAFS